MIPKAAMRATNNAMRGYIPHSNIVSAGQRSRQDSREKQTTEDRQQKTEKIKADGDKPQRKSSAERQNNGSGCREETARL